MIEKLLQFFINKLKTKIDIFVIFESNEILRERDL